jgi:hypothetical protein
MDVSRSEAKRAETNVIARSVDRATTTNGDNHCAKSHHSLRRKSQSFAQRTAVLCAEDSSPLSRGLLSFAQRIIGFCAGCRVIVAQSSHGHRTIVARSLRGLSRGRRCGRLRSRKNSAALRFYAHIHRPYTVRRPHPQSSTLFATPLDVHILNRRYSFLPFLFPRYYLFSINSSLSNPFVLEST